MSDDRKEETLRLFGKTLNEDGSLRAVSPSQIQTFKLCPLKWHLDKKENLPRKPPSKGNKIGTEGHNQNEHFLKTGQDVRGSLAKIGAPMLEPYLPHAPFNNGPGIVEGALIDPRLQTPGGILITGYYDFYIPGFPLIHGGYFNPVIIDHKFKKKLDLYAPDETELKEDIQAIIYGAWAVLRQSEATGVAFRHHNVQTEGEGGRFPKAVQVDFTRDEILEKWGGLARFIDTEMVPVARIPAVPQGQTPDVPHGPERACKSFGGCDFAATCPHSPQNKFLGFLQPSPSTLTSFSSPSTSQGMSMGLLAEIDKPPQISNPSNPAASPAPSTGGMVKASACVVGARYIFRPEEGPLTFAGLLGDKPTFNTASGALKQIEGGTLLSPVVDQSPPAAPVQAPATESTPKGIPVSQCKPGKEYRAQGGDILKFDGLLGTRYIFRDTKDGLRELAGDILVHNHTRIVDVTAPADVAAVAPPDVPRTEERAPAASAAVTQTPPPPAQATTSTDGNVAAGSGAPTQATPASVPAQAPAPAAKKRGRPTKAEQEARRAAAIAAGQTPPPEEPTDQASLDGLVLLVNCHSHAAEPLEGYVFGLASMIAKRFEAPDLRLAHQKTDAGFGGWKGLLAIEARSDFGKGLLNGIKSVQRSETTDPVIEALIPLASVVVYGGR